MVMGIKLRRRGERMKKRLAVLLAAFMAATALTACGGSGEQDGASDSSGSVVNSDDRAKGVVSDETFGILQQNYASMAECYNTVANAYNSDEIAANPEIESTMKRAADVIVQMGEIKRDALTEEDAVVLNNTIIEIVKGLGSIANAMEPAGGADGAAKEPVSEETFAALQMYYEAMVSRYNELAQAYNDGMIQKSEDFEVLMNKVREFIEQMGQLSSADMNEEEGQALLAIVTGFIESFSGISADVG